jgi:large conductance mechanosensitive channel
MLSEYKAFLLKTNALALAIGVIIGASLGQVVNSLVNDVIMPPIGYVLGGVDFSSLRLVLGQSDGKEVTINYGTFINTIVTFVIVAFIVFWVSKMFIPEEATDPTKECPFCREANAVEATKCKFCASPI